MKRVLATVSSIAALALVTASFAADAFADAPRGMFSMDGRRFHRDAVIVAQRAHNLLETARVPLGYGYRTLVMTSQTRALRRLDEAAQNLAMRRPGLSHWRLRNDVARVNSAFQAASRFVGWRAARDPMVRADLNEIAARLADMNAAFPSIATYVPSPSFIPQAQPTVTYAPSPMPTATYAPYPPPTVTYSPSAEPAMPAQPTSVYTDGAAVSWYQAR